jgi:hypothetical protein
MLLICRNFSNIDVGDSGGRIPSVPVSYAEGEEVVDLSGEVLGFNG